MSANTHLSRARLGITLTFALAGALCAVWTVRMPALKQKLDLTDTQLGLEVLGWGVGALITMTLAGRIISRFGSAVILRTALPATAACLALVGLAPTFPLLIAAGLAFGLCFGLVDVAMNTQASTVERGYGRPLMGGMHAGWSLGAVTGGLLGALTALLGLGFTAALGLVAVLSVPAIIAVGPLYLVDLAPDRETGSGASSATGATSDGPVKRRLPLLVYLIGALIFCGYLTEGSVADWSGVYLHDTLGSTQVIAALGYPLFEAAMFAGRVSTDRLTARLDARILLTAAGISSAAAFGLVVAAPSAAVAIIGFALVGACVCVVTPLAFSLAGASAADRPAQAIAVASTMGYSGLLLGPVAIGLIAGASSLHVGYAAVIALCLLIAVGARFLPSGQHIVPSHAAPDASATPGAPTGGPGASAAMPAGMSVSVVTSEPARGSVAEPVCPR
ncbi:MAG TPA: MFS transporter [Actinocrinis sp.]|nr:MFS transporter [Actinocrinis sp.]